jgi:hypothetical protein
MSIKQYPYWLIAADYSDNEDFFRARDRQQARAIYLGVYDMEWNHGQTKPADWNGYNSENPSPGHGINQHFWRLYDENDAMTFYLACGSSIRKIEGPKT